jgi:hypothetical protein
LAEIDCTSTGCARRFRNLVNVPKVWVALLPGEAYLAGAKMGNGYLKIPPLGQRLPQLKVAGMGQSLRSVGAQQEEVLEESVFHSMLTLERRRAERSRKPYVLMLLDANQENGAAEGILREAIDIIVASKRETDLVGWYRLGAILGIIFTEVSLEGNTSITETLRTKIETAFIKHMGKERASRIAISMHTGKLD